MRKGYGKLANRTGALAKVPVAELVELFGTWMPVEKAVGPPKRDRLFSPLTHPLAILGPGPCRRRLVRRSGAQSFGVASPGGKKACFTQDGGLL